MTKTLKSYVEGQWVAGTGEQKALYNPTTEEVIAQTSTEGVDFEAALNFARSRGGAALRELNFAQRGAIIAKVVKALHKHRDELLSLSTLSGGNTRGDAKFDVDGATFTLQHYAELGQKIGERRVILDGDAEQLTANPRYVGQHLLSPRLGAAVHINAFNFPAWGMGEKLATAWLAGMPAVVKPATSTLPLAARMVEIMVASGALPDGALTFIAGSCGDLVDHLDVQDVLAFTGSAVVGEYLRSKPSIIANAVRVNVEADSLNAALLGADVDSDSDTYDLFIREIVKDMTQKAGQKCTAIRRIFVPHAMLDQAISDLSERIGEIRLGDPSLREVRMGPLATAAQFKDVSAGIERLLSCTQFAYGDGDRGELTGISNDKGYFVSPTLLIASDAANAEAVHNHEVFGPLATIMGYNGEAAEVSQLVGLGRGGLVSSIYSDDRDFIGATVAGIAPYHGRLTIGSARVAEHSPGPGMVMPLMVHGGPGRAGGGEELGGMRGLNFYLQRTAVQGSKPLLEKILI
jgi:oxepin-CoA hydrolase/3-oxo-5,6-dehydrosuberyl-CoA semialdehyde dehydrogenase